MRKATKNLVGMLMMLILLLLVLVGVYAVGMRYYRNHFFSGATINGVDVSGMTIDEAKYQIQDRIREYSLLCKERSSQVEAITGSQIYMQYVDDGTIEKLMADQNEFLWPFSFVGGGKKYKADIGFNYDKTTIEKVMDQMRCFQSEFVNSPTNAHITTDGTKYYIEESTEGNQLNYEATRDAIMQAIEAGKTEIDFEAMGLYLRPKMATEDAAELQAMADKMNGMLASDITYDFVDRTYKVDREAVAGFIREDDDGNLELDEEAVAEWVYDMAYQTDTYGLSHQFRTTGGKEITLAYGGDYGWCIDQKATTAALVEAIRSGYQGELEPEYLYRGVDRSSNDIGDTYIEVCIEEQRMWCYKDGILIMDTPVVTGNHSMGWDTPSGHVWAVDARMPDKDFATVHVDLMLSFYGDCAIHDASWRENFGGSIWQYNGSHGCVNTPLEALQVIYDNIQIGDPVIIYYSEDEPVGPQPTGQIMVG